METLKALKNVDVDPSTAVLTALSTPTERIVYIALLSLVRAIKCIALYLAMRDLLSKLPQGTPGA